MYLAPLNYDRFFKKVFGDLTVSKKFLEDFLEIKIEEITKLETKHRVTDDSTLVEFDFRCKIAGSYVVIDMQQWYKSDVAHRFYVYHSLGSSLQLEDLPLKSIIVDPKTNEVKKVKDYRMVEPVITIVWMVDDVLGNTDDLLSYRMFPEDISYFLKNSELWDKPEIKKLLEEKDRLSKKLDNKTKNLDFIPQNRLVFAFQKNIVKNQRIKKYIRWFDLAAKTKKKENKVEDFIPFEEDNEFRPIYQKIKKRLIRDNLAAEELQYLTEETTRQEQIQRSIDGYVQEKDGEIEMLQKEKDQALEEKDQALEEKDQALQALEEKDQALEEKDQALEEKDQALENALKVLMGKGLSEEEAKKTLNL